MVCHFFQWMNCNGLAGLVGISLGADSIQRYHLTSIGNPIVEIRGSQDHLISTIGFPILVRPHLYTESGPRFGQSHRFESHWDWHPNITVLTTGDNGMSGMRGRARGDSRSELLLVFASDTARRIWNESDNSSPEDDDPFNPMMIRIPNNCTSNIS